MILPIRAYGDPVLRSKNLEINSEYLNLSELISNMFETMYSANGVGIAAPQIGMNIRLFVVDASPFAEDEDYAEIAEGLLQFKKVFINPKIISRTGELWKFNEGCLSIPDIHEDIKRHESIEIEYFDENWNKHRETYSDLRARIIQHEYDHLEGILFTDLLSPLKKKLLKNRLDNISKGNIKVNYKMKFIY